VGERATCGKNGEDIARRDILEPQKRHYDEEENEEGKQEHVKGGELEEVRMGLTMKRT
jgi:hypothetical protein